MNKRPVGVILSPCLYRRTVPESSAVCWQRVRAHFCRSQKAAYHSPPGCSTRSEAHIDRGQAVHCACERWQFARFCDRNGAIYWHSKVALGQHSPKACRENPNRSCSHAVQDLRLKPAVADAAAITANYSTADIHGLVASRGVRAELRMIASSADPAQGAALSRRSPSRVMYANG